MAILKKKASFVRLTCGAYGFDPNGAGVVCVWIVMDLPQTVSRIIRRFRAQPEAGKKSKISKACNFFSTRGSSLSRNLFGCTQATRSTRTVLQSRGELGCGKVICDQFTLVICCIYIYI